MQRSQPGSRASRGSGVPPRPPRVTVVADPADDEQVSRWAREVAALLSLPYVDGAELAAKQGEAEVLLAVTPDRLELRVIDPRRRPDGKGRDQKGLCGHTEDLMRQLGEGRAVAVDLMKVDVSSSMGRSLKQPLIRAVGVIQKNNYRPTVLDVTAGFGEDAWLLAALGCRVTAVERHPVMAMLLRDGLNRATASDPETAARLDVVHANSLTWLANPPPTLPPTLPPTSALTSLEISPDTIASKKTLTDNAPPDVIYVDPMFPLGRKTTERKPMRVLRWLAGEDADADALFTAACRVAGRRVVVKRPAKAPPLCSDPAPVASHHGRSIRYDVYTPTSRAA